MADYEMMSTALFLQHAIYEMHYINLRTLETRFS